MAAPRGFPPVVGDWFAGREGLFEVVALDDADGTIEIQHLDGSIEELDRDDWVLRCKAAELQPASQPEDYSGAIDIEPEEPFLDGLGTPHWVEAMGSERGLEGLDLFE